jgi:hypothetical protein
MPQYTPFASLLLAECLATDPFGTLHRAIDRSGHSAGRDVLVRRYHPHWLAAGLLRHPADIRRHLIHLGHLKLFQGVRLELEEAPHFIWPLCQGRSLATVLEAVKRQNLPFGLEPSLFLIWILCHHIAQLHRAGLPLGFLSPHRIWVGFDGLVELLDTPVVTQLEALIPGRPEVLEPMRAYLQGPRQEGIAQDAYQAGALLFEMLAHRPLPEARHISHELEHLKVHTLEGPEALPPSIRTMLSRMLGLARPFQTLEELEHDLETSLFGTGDINPSTFGLAFSMHTLFRFEIEAENRNLEEERMGIGGLDAYTAIQKGVPASAQPGRTRRKIGRIVLPAAAVLLGITAATAWSIHARQPEIALARSAEPMAKPVEPKPPTEPPKPAMAPSKPAAPESAVTAPPKPQAMEMPAPKPVEAPVERVVRLRVFVDEQGRVRQTHLLEGATSGSALETKALAAARELRLAPLVEGGQPVRAWREITVRVK